MSDGAAKLMMWGSRNSSALLTAIGESSLVGAVITGIFAGSQSARRLDQEKEERRRYHEPEMTTWEVVKLVAPYYIPTITLTLVSGGCFLFNIIKEDRKLATVAGLYSISEKSFSEYREKTKELFGEKKERKVRDEVATDHAQTALSKPHTVILTGNGNYLCLDAWSNTLFRSSQTQMERCRIQARDDLRDNMTLSLEEMYNIMDLPRRMKNDYTYLVDYSDIGWNNDDRLEFIYTYAAGDDGEPMMVITFDPPPHSDFKFYL